MSCVTIEDNTQKDIYAALVESTKVAGHNTLRVYIVLRAGSSYPYDFIVPDEYSNLGLDFHPNLGIVLVDKDREGEPNQLCWYPNQSKGNLFN